MYSHEERLHAVKIYFKLGGNAALTVRRLGYPDVTTLAHWVDEYQRSNSLHREKPRYSKYTEEQKAHAVRYYMEHGKNIQQTVKALGYPSRPLLAAWIEEKEPLEAERRCAVTKSYVRCTQEQRERAVLESCRGELTIKEIASIYDVTPATVSIWRRKLLKGKETPEMPATPDEDRDIIQLKKEKLELEAQVEALKKESYRLRLENDVLLKASELLKKDQGISLKKLSNRDKAIVIDALRCRYALKDLLAVLSMAKSSYCYQAASMRKPDKYAELRKHMRSAFNESFRCYGYRRLHAVVTAGGKKVSEKVVRRLMREECLVVYQKRRRRYNSYKGEISPAVENKLKRNFSADEPNCKWLTDITEFSIPSGKVYLSPIIDCFDGSVLSWTTGVSPDAKLVNTMLDKAIVQLKDGERPVVHSDRGCHYRWPGWIERMEKAGLTRSMSKKGCSPDNSACEGFFGRLKNEMFYCRSWSDVSIDEFIQELDRYIHWYNEDRIKMSLGAKSPFQYRRSLGLVI
jgi:transposase InsO family protein/transposase-like protein